MPWSKDHKGASCYEIRVHFLDQNQTDQNAKSKIMKTINRWHTWTCFLSCPDLRQEPGATPALVVGRHQRQHWEDMTCLSVLSKGGSWSAWNLLRLLASAPSVSLEPGLPNNISHDWACHTRTGNRQTVPCQSVDIHNPHPWQHWTVHLVGTPEAGVYVDVMFVLWPISKS